MTKLIGTLNEQPLHAALKRFYAGDTGQIEKEVAGYIIDVCQSDQLIEIQTQHFSAIKKKIFELIPNHKVLLVYPVASEKWLLKLPMNDGGPVERRKSPKQGRAYEIFYELVRIPDLLSHHNFSLEIVLVDIEELRQYSGKKPWVQNGWQTVEQHLIRVVKRIPLETPGDLLKFLPETLPVNFTTGDIKTCSNLPHSLSQKMAYCMREAGVIRSVGKKGRYNLYEKAILDQEKID